MADLTTLYNECVKAVADSVGDEWEHIVVNYELRHRSRSTEEDSVSLYIHKVSGDYKLENFELSEAAEKGFHNLSDALYEQKGSRWGASTLTIEKNGTYNFDFSYEPPKRLAGIYDKDSFDFYNNYLEHYLKENAA